MSEILHLFSKIGEKNDLIKVLNRYKHKEAARLIATRMTDEEYQRVVPTLNKAIACRVDMVSKAEQFTNEEIKRLSDEHGLLEIAIVIMELADKYADSLRKGLEGMNPEDSNTEVARKLREALKLEAVARYLEGRPYGNTKQT